MRTSILSTQQLPMRIPIVFAALAAAGPAFAQAAPPLRQPTPSPAAATGATADAKTSGIEKEAAKARDDFERRMKERDRKLGRALKSICVGC